MTGFAEFAVAAGRVPGAPDWVPGADVQRGHAAGLIGQFCVEEAVRHIDSLAVDRESPQHTAAAAALARLLFPDGFPLLVRVQRPDFSGFVSRDQHGSSIPRFDEDGRYREIHIRRVSIRAGRGLTVAAPAGAVPDIVLRLLTMPSD